MSALKAKVGTPSDTAELKEALKNIAAETVAEGKDSTPDATAAKNASAELTKILGDKATIDEALEAFIRPLIPKTFYFSTYAQLQGRYALSEALTAVKSGSKNEATQTAADFLRLAKVTAANVETWNYEQSKAELEAVSSLLTQRVKANWKQNQHLKLAVEVEATTNPQNNQVERFLQFRVEDSRHDFSNPLDRRSTGFQWFVSFIASFFEFEKNKNLVLLLDEPGLSLHARAQMDLLDSIEKNLTGGRQVIYTTHSPFMVRTEALDRARIVEDKGPEKGSVVSNDAGHISDPDTLFPLQAALGYDIAQNLFIGNRNILMEGVSDFIYLTVVSTLLKGKKRAHFPLDCRLLPARGATNIPTFIALLGGMLDLVVLIDGSAPRQKIENAVTQGRLNSGRVFTVEQFCKVKDADIEDLFEPSEYLAIYNAALGKSLKLAQLKGSDPITKRIAREEGDFDHGEVAAHFLANLDKFLPKLSDPTLDRFEDCIKTLVKALPAAKKP